MTDARSTTVAKCRWAFAESGIGGGPNERNRALGTGGVIIGSSSGSAAGVRQMSIAVER